MPGVRDDDTRAAGDPELIGSPDHPLTMRGRLLRTGVWIGGVALVILILDLLGVPVSEWIRSLFKKVEEVPLWAVVAGVILQSLQTSFAALAWLGILRVAFPTVRVSFRLVLASYAVAVALNSFLPANIGTFVMLVMFTTVIAGATFAALLSGLVVQNIPFSIFNVSLYLYLFLSVSGSFSIKLSFLAEHPILVLGIIAGLVFGVVALARLFRRRWRKLREQLIVGGAILRQPRVFLVRVALPEFGSYVARLAIIGVFLAAYGIPVTFHTVATVTASNSISNAVSVTPGGVGVTQAMNTAALSKDTDASSATAYSIAQQLITSAWNVLFAVLLVSWVFGWTGGRKLVEASYEDAKVKGREMKEEHEARRSAKRAAEA